MVTDGLLGTHSLSPLIEHLLFGVALRNWLVFAVVFRRRDDFGNTCELVGGTAGISGRPCGEFSCGNVR